MSLGKKIKQLRKERNLSQSELARKIGASYPSTISNWEKGLSEPNSIFRKKLCKVFNISQSTFFATPQVLKESKAQYLNSEILKALDDPTALKVLLTTAKQSKNVKGSIMTLIKTVPKLSSKKRKAVLDLCK